jgi:EAL domain-containing protein (putative c-di-GMP-specific phosphodiesterase class I)
VLGQIAHLAAVALDFDQARILLEERPEPTDGSPAADGEPTPLPAGPWAALDGLVRERGSAVVLNDVSEADTGPPALPGAYVGVPIWVGDGVVGVLRLTDAEPRSIPVRQVRLLVEFSRLAGLYLQPAGVPEHDVDTDRAAVELARALRDGEIVPWYQPIIDLASDRVVGVEALARWHRPNGEFEPPAAFIPVAERTDLIIDLDFAIMRQAFAHLAQWHAVRPDFRLSVNLSGRHLERDNWLDDLIGATTEAGISADTVDLELTETARPSDIERGWLLIQALRERGYTVWFDDFGAGYYDLQDLVRLPVDGLKIDRAFAQQLDQPMNDALVGALTGAAARVGLQVTIEGIETPRQAELALALGCDYAQGFFWSRPVPPEQVNRWLVSADPATDQPVNRI